MCDLFLLQHSFRLKNLYTNNLDEDMFRFLVRTFLKKCRHISEKTVKLTALSNYWSHTRIPCQIAFRRMIISLQLFWSNQIWIFNGRMKSRYRNVFRGDHQYQERYNIFLLLTKQDCFNNLNSFLLRINLHRFHRLF